MGRWYGAGENGDSFGAFIKSLRRARGMTQAQYAPFLRLSLRTLITEEKDQKRHPAYSGSAVGIGLVPYEFMSHSAMCSAYYKFRDSNEK